MTSIVANVPGLPPMHFPAGTDPAVIQKTVQSVLAGTHPDLQAQPPAPDASAPAPAPVAPPAAPAPQPAPAGGGDGMINDAEKMAQNVAQGGTFGMSDSIGAGLAKPVTYALKNVLPSGMGGEDVSYDQVSHAIDTMKGKSMSDLQAWNEQNPVKALASQVAGGVAMMGPLGDLAATAAPETTSALQAYSKLNPYKAAAATGAVTGGLYAGGEALPGHTLSSGAAGAAGGAILGPAFKYASDEIINPALEKVGAGLKAGKSALQDFLKSSEDGFSDAEDHLQKPTINVPPSPTLGFSNITNKPLGATPANTTGPVTGNLPLSPGVANKDTNLLRIEENAKQGLLGPDAQNQMKASNDAVFQAARDAMQSLKGVTNKDSDSLLTDAVTQFQKQAKTVKDSASALYTARDAALENAVVNKKMVGPSLGGALSDLVTQPGIKSALKVPSNSAAADLYTQFKDMVTSPGKELPMSDVVAYRKSITDVAGANQGNQTGFLANKLGGVVDDWLENKLTPKMMISGDPDIADKIKAASSAWKNYKTLFGSENSPVIEGMTKPYDAVPAEFVDKVFGGKIAGNSNTSLNVRKMIAALPAEQQQQFKDNIFSGLVSKVFEGAGDADQLSLAKLRNNLSALQNSNVYKQQFAKDATKDPIITNLIKDLSQQITQTGRKDIISPSGGAVMRGVQQLVNGAANNGLTGLVPGIHEVNGIVNKISEMGAQSEDRAAFNAAMKTAAKTAHAAARAAPVFDLNALKSGVVGGMAASNVVQQDNEGEPK